MTSLAVAKTQPNAAATQPESATEPQSDDLKEGLALLETPAETQDAEGQKPAVVETESEEPDEETKTLLDATSARVAEEARAAQRKEDEDNRATEDRRVAAENRLAGIQQSFNQRAPMLRDVLSRALAGETILGRDGAQWSTEQVLNWAIDQFSAHHGQSRAVASVEYADAFYEAASAALPDEEQKAFLANKDKHGTFAEALKDRDERLIKNARTGHFTDAQVKEKEALAAVKVARKYQQALKDDPTGASLIALLGSKVNPARSRQGVATNANEPKTLAEAQEMHAGLHASGRKITTAEMRAMKLARGWT